MSKVIAKGLGMIVSETMGEITLQITHASRFPTWHKELMAKHSKNLDDFKRQYDLMLAKCVSDDIDPQSSPEFVQFMEKYTALVKEVNSDCMVQMMDCSATLIEELSAAHSHFVEGIMLLASVYGSYDLVDLKAVAQVYDDWYVEAMKLNPHYKSCKTIHELSGDEREKELVRHRLAAMIYGVDDFSEVPGTTGYKKICPQFQQMNENTQTSTNRTRIFMKDFSLQTLKSSITWEVVKFRKEGIYPARLQQHLDKQKNLTVKDRNSLIEANLKQTIVTVAGICQS
jgi:hypothetical protein